ncbi:MAG: AbrB family transcriptional regulator [Bacillota bacterium]
MTLVLLSGLGYLGYRIFNHFDLPAAGLVGAMFATAAASVVGFSWAPVPGWINILLQAVVGVMIGSKIGRESLSLLRTLVFPSLMVAAWMVGTGVVVGWILSLLTTLDFATSIFSAAPGGIAEMSVIALDYGADVSAVALLQFIRIMGTYALVPAVSQRFGRRLDPGPAETAGVTQSSTRESPGTAHPLYVTLGVGLLGGFSAWWVGIPAGGIVGSMLSVGSLQIAGIRLRGLPRSGIVAAQIGLGGILGLNFDPEMLSRFGTMIAPVLLLTALLLGAGLALGFVLHYVFGWDLTTALLSSAAAGLTQMGAIALEMEADAVRVSLLHLVRIVAIILFLPPIIAYMVG